MSNPTGDALVANVKDKAECLVSIPEGAVRVDPHTKLVDGVPKGIEVYAFKMPDGMVLHCVALLVHVDVVVEDSELALPEAEFADRVLKPCLYNLGEYARFKTIPSPTEGQADV